MTALEVEPRETPRAVGPKARVQIDELDWAVVATGERDEAQSDRAAQACRNLSISLRSALASTGRFLVVSAPAGDATSPVAADLLVRATVLEWVEDAAGGDVGFEHDDVDVRSGSSTASVLLAVEVVDLATLDTVFADDVRALARSSTLDLGGNGTWGGTGFEGLFAQHERASTADAARAAIDEVVRRIALELPDPYFRH